MWGLGISCRCFCNSARLLLLLFFDDLFLRVAASSSASLHVGDSLHELVEARSLILKQVEWVVLHRSVYPALVDILLRQESRDFVCMRILAWLLVVSW